MTEPADNTKQKNRVLFIAGTTLILLVLLLVGSAVKNANLESYKSADRKVLGIFDRDKNYTFISFAPSEFKEEALFEKGFTSDELAVFLAGISTPNIGGLLNIDETTKTSLENSLAVTGQVYGTNLQSVKINQGIINGEHLVDEFSYDGNAKYSGELNVTGAFLLNGEEIEVEAEIINMLEGLELEEGGILFGAGDSFAQNPDDFYWDDDNTRLGIGTDNPAYTLDVYGSMRVSGSAFLSGATYLNGIGYIWPTADGSNGQLLSTDGSGNLAWYSPAGVTTFWTDAGDYISADNTTSFVITDSGNLGIGTTVANARLSLATATNAAGGIDFGGDTNLYRLKANTLSLGTGDSLIIPSGNVGLGTTDPQAKLVLNNGQLWLADGTAALPALSFGGDSNTGLYHISDDVISLITGGVVGRGLTIDASGFVGIGITTPSALLHLFDTTEQLRLGYDATNYMSFTVDSNGELTFSDTGTTVARIGGVGASFDVPTAFNAAGDASVAYDLNFTNLTAAFINFTGGPGYIRTTHPIGNYDLTLSAANSGNVVVQDTLKVYSDDPYIALDTQSVTDTDYWLGVVENSDGVDNDYFAIGNGSTVGSGELFVVNTDGNVGIGLTTPEYKLDIAGDINVEAGSDIYLEGVGLYATHLGNRTYTEDNYVTDDDSFTSSIDDLDTALNDLETGERGMWLDDTGNGFIYPTNYDSFVITDTGNIGIGTTDPGYELDVQGDIGVKYGSDIYLNDEALFTTQLGDRQYTGNYHVLDSQTFTASVEALDSAINDLDTGVSGMWLDGGTFLYPANFNTLVITDTGRLGVGTTDPNTALEVVGEIRGTRFAFQDDINTYLDTTDADEISFFTNSNNVMTLNSNGNLGIGSTNPGVKLDVIGNARFSAVGSGGYSNPLNITADGTLTTQTSDITMKTNLQSLGSVINNVLKMNPYTFNWKDDPLGQTDVGFVAQEMADIFPELTFINPTDGKMGIRYPLVSVYLTKAFQEQNELLSNQGVSLEEMDKEIETFSRDVLGIENSLAGLTKIVDNLKLEQGKIKELVSLQDVPETSFSQEKPDTILAKMIELFEEFKTFAGSLGMSATEDEGLLIDNDLNVLGDTTFQDVSIVGDLSLGLLSISGFNNAIDIAGKPCHLENVQPEDEVRCIQNELSIMNSQAGRVVFFGGTIILEPNGTIKANYLSLGKESVGSGAILEGENDVVIESSLIMANSKVFITSHTNISTPLYIKGIVEGQSLTVALGSEEKATENIYFDWLIVDAWDEQKTDL